MALFTPFAFYGGVSAPAPPPSYDPDAQAFFNALQGGGDVLTPSEKNAVNQLVLDLKGYSLWTKMVMFYPIVGGTATAHKWNLMDPQDTDAAFRIVWNGGWTHNSSGAFGDGVNAWGDTKFQCNVEVAARSLLYDIQMGIYSTNPDSGEYDLGAYQPGTGDWIVAARLGSPGQFFFGGWPGSTFLVSSNTDGRGFYVNQEKSPSTCEGYRNGVLVGFNTSIGMASGPNLNLGIACSNRSPSPVGYSYRNFASVHLGKSLGTTEQANLYTAVQTYQTALGRQV